MIDVIIPAYNSHRTIKNTLMSLAIQTIVDKLNIIIVNDCSKKDYSDEVNFFSKYMKIKEIKLEKNSGPGVARQKGIDCSNSKYIVFIDSDDIFFSPDSISILYREISNNNYDVLISNFLLEKDNYSLEEKDKDLIWLHGKIYKRKFLEKNDIKFNNSSANEDTGFNRLIFLLDANIGYIEDITYLWCKNDLSITRKNNREYKYSGIIGYIYNMTWAIEKAIEKGIKSKKLKESIFYTLVSTYFYYLQFINKEDSDNILRESKKIKKIYDNNKITSIEKRNELFFNEYYFLKNDLKNVKLYSPEISFDEFLKRIEEV